MELIIREFENKDIEDVLKLHVEAMKFIGAYKGDGEWDDDLRNIKEIYSGNAGAFLVGELEGEIVAMGAFKKSKDYMAEVKRMRVSPLFQGNGFGRMIYGELEVRAQNIGYKGFHLETSEIQKSAQKLYERSGFKEIRRELIDGFSCIIYEKLF